MLGQMRGEAVERRLHARFEARGRAPAEPRKIGAAKVVAGEEAVDVGAGDEPVGGDRAVRRARRSRGTAARSPALRSGRDESRSRRGLRRSPLPCRKPAAVVLSPPSTVSTASSPSPATVPAGPRRRRDRRSCGRASGSRRKARAPRRRADDAPGCRCPIRRAVSAARSAIVDFDPGSGPGRNRLELLAPARHLDRHVRLGGERIEVVEIGDARKPRHGDLDPRPGRRAAEGRPSTSSAGSRAASAKCGTTPSDAQPVRCAISASPSSKSEGSPRKLVDDERLYQRLAPPDRAPHACRPARRSRRRGRCRRRARPARWPPPRSPCWRCRRGED